MSRRILIIKLSSIGDVVHALPVARSLRLGHPDAFLSWAVHRSCAEVVEDNPYLDEIFVVEDKSLRGILGAGTRLAERGFDTAVDLQGLFRTGLLALQSGAWERIGFTGNQEMRRLFINRPAVDPRVKQLPPYAYLEFARAAGGAEIDPVPQIFLRLEHRQEAAELLAPALARGGPIIALNPGARWDTKRWQPERYAAVGDRLVRETGAEIVLIGSSSERPLTDRISAAMSTPPLVLSGQTTLKTLAAVLERSALYVGGDTGPMHIAAAMGTPVAAIFGPTDPEKTAPVGSPYRIIRSDVPCAPCRLRECSHHSCMEFVREDQVVSAALSLLRSPTLRV